MNTEFCKLFSCGIIGIIIGWGIGALIIQIKNRKLKKE